ncbi:MAG: YtpR family tRNA-binding protein, partial [Pseudomonadota bacterium]
MKFTLSWLKDFLETDASLSDISDKLNNIGLEVESIHDPDAKLGAFTVGRIVKAEKHPDADRLKVCTVATKDGELQIICGAPNARADINICLSVPGMYIPGLDITLKKGKIRGIESCGMLCSYEELGLEGDNTGIIELPEAAKIGDKVIDVLGINDPLIEISITPNRPDALGVYGIARDLAAAGLGKLKTVHIPDYKGAFKSPISVTVQHPESCPHFVGAYISGVKNVKAPDWMVKRLAAVGCSSHSALVDITNYMSYSFARPLHVFDADKIGKNISARLAKPDEEIISLKDISYHLEDKDIVIADEEKPHAIAGIMGGLESGCSDDT